MTDELTLSGERFTAVYTLTGDTADIPARAADICIEQTVEFPEDLISREDIRRQIFGRVRRIDRIDETRHRVEIDFPTEAASGELTQLMNVLFGNISLKPGIQLTAVDLPDAMASTFKGPRYGIPGLRRLTGNTARPLVCTALKPMGLSNRALADIAYRFAKGGVDFIKDDHGLTNQSFSPFEDRMRRVSDAVARANDETGNRCRYVPNITAPAGELLCRARYAKSAGAGGLLIAPGIVGVDAMRDLADNDDIALPIFSHPALQGSFTVHPDAGMTPGVLFGTFNRLAGADAAIFPNFGGRFSFTKAACRDLAERCTAPVGSCHPVFPVPAGGMSVERVREMRAFYGDDIILLIGGDLHRHGDLTDSARRFVATLS